VVGTGLSMTIMERPARERGWLLLQSRARTAEARHDDDSNGAVAGFYIASNLYRNNATSLHVGCLCSVVKSVTLIDF
jgi:hypothetical protein